MASIAPSSLDQLRLVTVSDRDSIDLSVFPDFLIAGPQRTGSTWLHEVLRWHPEVFASEPKEIYFFNTLVDENHPQRVSTELSWYLKHFHDESVKAETAQRLRQRFDVDYTPRVYGEATASYAAAMSDEMIQDVVTLNPDIKVIISLRHPVDRIWSHAKKDLGKTETRRRLEDVPESEFRAFFEHPYNQKCGFYTKQIEQWSKFVKPGNLFIGKFDDVTRRPVDYVLDVMKFIGVEPNERYLEGVVDRNPNPTEPVRNVPEPFGSLLNKLYGEEIETLRERYGVNW